MVYKFSHKIVKVAGKNRKLNAIKDVPDIRDRWYEPALIQLKHKVDNRRYAYIRDQGEEGACTGFGLAAAIDVLNRKNAIQEFKASARMLYEMAKKHDEWPGDRYSGSSCRGAIRGWKNMGVCAETDWRFVSNKAGTLSVGRAVAARRNALGAYYRLRPEVNDYHAALNEVDAIYVSADVHDGWWEPKAKSKNATAVIQPSSTPSGGHAFCIVGYNGDGFIVQNSWGKTWGSKGFALWLYEDWLANICDGWVFRLAVPTPQIFGVTARSRAEAGSESAKSAPKRLEIAGHFAHFDDGNFKPRGDYWSSAEDIQHTANLLKTSADKYQHLLIFAHGGLNSPKASATRIAALKDGFRRNGIYPFHIMYDTGLGEELKDAVLRAFTSQRTEGFLRELGDKLIERTDTLIEDLVRKPVTPLWDEMKRDARVPFEQATSNKINDGTFVIQTFAESLRGTGMKNHLAGHSTGGVLLGHLLGALDRLGIPDLIASCSLMAPACTIDFYKTHYQPRLGKSANGKVSLPVLDIYNLNKQLELDDQVAAVYRKSLLYLVSRSFERATDAKILGMQRYSEKLSENPALKIVYSNGKTGSTRSESHGGFDNDVNTMNSLLKRILGKAPSLPFAKEEMKGY
ncbi:MAG: C1 family peptidase [Pseudohongiella sp.]|nr:C1 family peptidase [Pseudohongiella sp.]